MKLAGIVVLAICCLVTSGVYAARTVTKHITSQDADRYANIFSEGLRSNDLQSVYFSSLHVTSAEKTPEACKRLAAAYGESKLNDFEKNFYYTGAWKNLACKDAIPAKVGEQVKASLQKKDIASSQEIYFVLASAKTLGLSIDDSLKATLGKQLQAMLKKDDSLNSLGHGFVVAAELGSTHGAFAYDRIEEAFVQADEVDGKMLQFEGGLSITALVVNGAFKLASALKKPVPINADQAVKFANYFLSRSSVQTPKGVSVLLESLGTISGQASIAPICIKLVGNGQLEPEKPTLSVKVSDMLGKPLRPALAVVAATITSTKGEPALPTKVNMVPSASDATIFTYGLDTLKTFRGQYKVDIVAAAYSTSFKINMLGKVKLNSLEIGVGDSDSATVTKKHTVTFGGKLPSELAADAQQKLVLKTQLFDEGSGKTINVHQAFVLLRNKATKEEIVFVAEADSSKAYKFEMDVGARGADFGYKSGVYSIEMIVGDALISNSFKWHIGDVSLKFAGEATKETTNTVRKPLPEIVHQFRAPERRPPRFMSDLFTAFCVAPFVLLLLLWAKLGVNVSNFPVSLSAIGFHVGLGAILALFGVFWLQLNMFETIRYLLPLALFTFLSGNRLLRTIAVRSTEK